MPAVSDTSGVKPEGILGNDGIVRIIVLNYIMINVNIVGKKDPECI